MGLFRYELRGLRPPLVYLKSLLHLRRSDRAVIVFILLPQCFEPLLLPPLLLQLFLLLPKLGQKEKETKKRRKLTWKMGDTVYMYIYIYIQRRDIFRLPSTDASVARAVRPTVVLAPDIVAGEFVVEADDAVVAETERERERTKSNDSKKISLFDLYTTSSIFCCNTWP